jgi:hypothetical protein
MANYSQLKAAIADVIKTNGTQAITGQVLQDVLNSIVSVIGANYTFAGVATPATNPGTPDQNVMYLAMEGGTYTNFNGTVLPAGISLLMWNGTWMSETVMYGDVYQMGMLALFGDLKKQKYYITNAGNERYSGRNDLYASPFIPLNGEEINVSLINFSQYGHCIAFYNIYKSFISGWDPSGQSYGKISLTVPASEIPADAVYARFTFADDGGITSGYSSEIPSLDKRYGKEINDAVKELDFMAFGARRKPSYYIKTGGVETLTDRDDISASPFIPLNGEDINVSLINYSKYGHAIAFYDANKVFTHGWNPDNNPPEGIKRSITCPASEIQSGDVYMRVTFADSGVFTSGYISLSKRYEENAELFMFGARRKVQYFIKAGGVEANSGRNDVAASPFVTLNGEDIKVSLINYSQYGPAIAFYDANRIFISGWDPSGQSYGKIELNVPSSDIPANAVFARVTFADDGMFMSGYAPIAQGLEKEIESIREEIETNVLPAYWLTHLAGKLPLIHANEEDVAMNGDSFFFLTDYHIENNAGYSDDIIKYIQERCVIKNLVFGGDIFNGSTTKDGALDKLREFYHRFYPITYYGLRGNHEFNLNDGGGQAVKLNDSEIFNYLIRKEVDNVILGGNDKLYYYRDIDRLKLRYIYLDARYENSTDPIDDTQLSWMTSRITELQLDWSVIIFSHQLFALVSPGSPVTTNPGYNASGQKIINALTSISTGAKIVAIITGHTHYDYSTNEHGFWEICTTCDTRQEYGGLPTTLGTPNEQAFDVFSVNLSAKTLKAVRIGRGSDRSWTY